MGSLTGLSDLVNRVTGGSAGAPEFLTVFKSGYTTTIASSLVITGGGTIATGAAATVLGRWTSLWQYNGMPTDGAVPTGASSVPINTTAGALQQTNPSGAAQKWFLGAIGGGLTTGTLIVYDRLCHSSGLNTTLTGAQTTNLPTAALTRMTGGVGNQIWLEIYQPIGASAVSAQASYTNQAGASGRLTVMAPIGGAGFAEDGRIIVLPLQQSDTGVQAVASITFTASTGTAGNVGVTIANPLFAVPFPEVGFAWRDLVMGVPSMVECVPNACVAFAWIAGTVTPPQIMIGLNFISA